MSGFAFNRIYVIESLNEKDGDKQTGKELYDDVLKWKELGFGGILKTIISSARQSRI